MSEQLPQETMCADCGGWDIEWMHVCLKHPGVQFCRGCECPCCADEAFDDPDTAGYYDGDEERS